MNVGVGGGERPVRGVVVATVGLAAAALAGFVAGGVVYSIIGLTIFDADATTNEIAVLGAVVVLTSVAAGVLAAAMVLTRRVVPRVAGRDGPPLPVARARALVVVAALATAGLVGLASLGGAPRLVLGWTVAVAGSGVAGAFSLAAEPRTARRGFCIAARRAPPPFETIATSRVALLASIQAHLGAELDNPRVFTEDSEADAYIKSRRGGRGHAYGGGDDGTGSARRRQPPGGPGLFHASAGSASASRAGPASRRPRTATPSASSLMARSASPSTKAPRGGSAPVRSWRCCAKLGLDLGYTSSDSRLTGASFLGVGPDGERVLVAWPACTG